MLRLGAAAPLAAAAAPLRLAAQTLAPLKIVSAPTMGARAALYAQQAGIFRKYGLAVEIIAMASGAAGMAALLGGSVDVDYVNLISLAQAHEKGIGAQIIAPGNYYDTNHPYALLFVRKDAPVKTGRDLNGKTIASGALKDINAICTLAWIDANGGDSKTVRAIEVSNPTIMAALDEERIDAATLLPPFQTVALESGKYRTLGKSYDAVAKHFAVAGWVASSDFIAKNPDVALRFTNAMRESAAETNANPAKSNDLVAAFTKVDAGLVARSVGSGDPPYLDVADVQPVIEAAVKYGVVGKSFDGAELLNAAVRRPK